MLIREHWALLESIIISAKAMPIARNYKKLVWKNWLLPVSINICRRALVIASIYKIYSVNALVIARIYKKEKKKKALVMSGWKYKTIYMIATYFHSNNDDCSQTIINGGPCFGKYSRCIGINYFIAWNSMIQWIFIIF